MANENENEVDPPDIAAGNELEPLEPTNDAAENEFETPDAAAGIVRTLNVESPDGTTIIGQLYVRDPPFVVPMVNIGTDLYENHENICAEENRRRNEGDQIIDVPEANPKAKAKAKRTLKRCASLNQKKQLVHLERQRSLLLEDATKLNRRCEEVVASFMSNCSFFLTIIGMSLIGSFVISSVLTMTIVIGVFVSLFFSSVGCGGYVMYSKLKDLEWDFYCMGNRISDFTREVESLKTNLKDDNSGCWVPIRLDVKEIEYEIGRVEKILETVKHDGRFKSLHLFFLGMTLFCLFGYLVTSMVWMYFLHRGEIKLVMSINPRPT